MTVPGTISRMPWGIRIITFFCTAFSIFAPASLIPFGEHSISGVHVSFAEFWRQGGGPTFLLAGCCYGFAAYGFLKARPWARLLFFLITLVATFSTLLEKEPIHSTVGWLAINWLVYWYLFLSRAARAYFFENQASQSPGND